MMPTWPTTPTWSDPTEINKGNKYNARDGVTAADLNLIIIDLMYLKKYKGESVPLLQEKTVNANGEVTPDEGFDGLSKVIVAVPILNYTHAEGVKF